MGSSSSVPEKSTHEFTVKNSKGNDINLSSYKGKVLLVVNVASKCGFTNSNYTQLTELHSKYKDKDRLPVYNDTASQVSRYWHSRATSSCIKNPEQAKMQNNLLAPDSKLSIPFSRR
ncbi:hypothetical protein SASPL_137616 [Salvia splendens]|uniref:Glutathione peroxidase n=1 Tax=Salvia splendens TaxID=180675 RepID=A0A8X8WVA9_SALSN|nr:hypothetical protein SASPL_137616 [Salvia splendens]